MSELLDLSARDVLEGFQDKTVSPADYMAALCDRVDTCEPKVCALYAYHPDDAMAKARASESRVGKGEPVGPLDGMPVTVKELIASRTNRSRWERRQLIWSPPSKMPQQPRALTNIGRSSLPRPPARITACLAPVFPPFTRLDRINEI